jgi:hypothetical protein
MDHACITEYIDKIRRILCDKGKVESSLLAYLSFIYIVLYSIETNKRSKCDGSFFTLTPRSR